MAKKTKEVEVNHIEEKFPLCDYIDNAKALGYEKYIVIGALFNCQKTELSKSEFGKLIKDFLNNK